MNARAMRRAAALLGVGLAAACGKPQAPAAPDAKAPVHEHHAPHGGALTELGEGEFAHLELVFDAASGAVTAYSLDGEAENPIRLKQDKITLSVRSGAGPGALSLVLAARPNSLTGETVGDTSEFVGRTARLKGAAAFSGVVSVIETKGQTFHDVPFSYPQAPEEAKK